MIESSCVMAKVSVQFPVALGKVTVQVCASGEELTVTVPVGVPAPCGATVTVTVTGWPVLAGDGVTEVIVVVVLACEIVAMVLAVAGSE